MSTPQIKQPKPRCSLCHKEIPHTEELTIEGKEYAHHFCGQGCFTQWEQQNKEKKTPAR